MRCFLGLRRPSWKRTSRTSAMSHERTLLKASLGFSLSTADVVFGSESARPLGLRFTDPISARLWRIGPRIHRQPPKPPACPVALDNQWARQHSHIRAGALIDPTATNAQTPARAFRGTAEAFCSRCPADAQRPKAPESRFPIVSASLADFLMVNWPLDGTQPEAKLPSPPGCPPKLPINSMEVMVGAGGFEPTTR